MIDFDVGEFERRDIQEQVRRVLRDLDNPEPPLRLDDVRQLLKLDLRYYDGSDSGLVAELSHRVKLFAKKKLPEVGKHVRDVINKSKLVAFWVPESKRVLIDSSVPKPKHRWIEGHEITHSITPWHREFLLGDNEQTLDPICRAILEAEANYGSGQLLFLQERFGAEARELKVEFPSVQTMADRYASSITSTLWRFVEERDPSQPVFGMISIHPNYPTIGRHDGPDPWRYFIRSAGFKTQFSNITPETAYELIARHATYRKGGPVVDADDSLEDVRGDPWVFKIDSFSNTHALLTLASASAKRSPIVVVQG